nr:MAG TPA: hypothetical protein [Caudoviricetes sp.]
MGKVTQPHDHATARLHNCNNMQPLNYITA